MQKLKKLRDLEIIKTNLMRRQLSFCIDKKPNNRYVIIDSKKTAHYNSSTEEIKEYFRKKDTSLMIAVVHREVDRYIVMNNLKIEKIDNIHGSFYKDHDAYSAIQPGTQLMYIDIRHAYWRVAMVNRYISKYTYKKYAEDPDFKLARNIALSTLSTNVDREYYLNGKYFNSVGCANTARNQIYKNIRHHTYNIVGEMAETIGEACYNYRTDGLLVLNDPAVVDFAIDHFRKNSMLIKITPCIKVDDYTYRDNKDNLKKFI